MRVEDILNSKHLSPHPHQLEHRQLVTNVMKLNISYIEAKFLKRISKGFSQDISEQGEGIRNRHSVQFYIPADGNCEGEGCMCNQVQVKRATPINLPETISKNFLQLHKAEKCVVQTKIFKYESCANKYGHVKRPDDLPES